MEVKEKMPKTIIVVVVMCLLFAVSVLAVDVNPYLNPQPEPPIPKGSISRESLMDKFDSKALKNGDTLKIINGQIFIRTAAGKQTAVQSQILELQNGTKITVQDGKIVQEFAPGINR